MSEDEWSAHGDHGTMTPEDMNKLIEAKRREGRPLEALPLAGKARGFREAQNYRVAIADPKIAEPKGRT
ncbi:MAG: hypothetical protein ACOYNL_11230 [Rickettsiales bacterium]